MLCQTAAAPVTVMPTCERQHPLSETLWTMSTINCQMDQTAAAPVTVMPTCERQQPLSETLWTMSTINCGEDRTVVNHDGT